ncbi:MAG TPA: CPBP family intramembrane glutamic endopeptidase [Ignavibacteriaceae bacterium]|nr:CPBP family intramembrane glutamic endopeptidase [Ignavibacteriaceae bacterium]
MEKSGFKLKYELKNLLNIIKSLDKKVIYIFISVAILQTFSYYVTSRRFFRLNFFPYLQSDPNIFLIEYLYWFIGDFFTYFIFPFLIIKLLLKEKITDYGVSVGDYKTGIKITLFFLWIMLPLVWVVSSLPEFAKTYPHLSSARNSWKIFLIFESGMLLYMFSWEFIWRGFMLFGLKEKFGYYAVLIQMIPFLILHNGKPAPETFGAIVGGIALGILALRTNSILYCVLTHMSVMFSIDLISVLRFKADDYGLGINSLLKIIKEII